MAGEAIRQTSAWEQILAPVSVGAGAVTTAKSASIDSTTTLSANEKLYDLMDLELVVTGTPSADGVTVDVFREPNANGAGKAPTLSYPHDYLDSFTLKAEADGSYYRYSVPVGDESDTYYLKNNSGNALTLALVLRTRTSNTAT
jgi:hypothetical protein